MPNKGLSKYVARFCHVIKVLEFRTSITCPCTDRTQEYQIPEHGIICEHLERKKYDRRLETKHWAKRSKWCCLREEGDLYFLHPFRDCPDLHQELNLRVIRHRVCPHCAEQYANSSLRNPELPWTMYLADICQRRSFDHKAVWHKDIMAAFNMRQILQHYAESCLRAIWNLPDRQRVL
ncbi:hypothetical protein Unana1_06239 [Umbelopsis nana]